jgi:hypothetical protein
MACPVYIQTPNTALPYLHKMRLYGLVKINGLFRLKNFDCTPLRVAHNTLKTTSLSGHIHARFPLSGT